jgi:hypothetical protein
VRTARRYPRFPLTVTAILVAVAVGGVWFLFESPRGSTTAAADLEAVVVAALADSPPDERGEVRRSGGSCPDGDRSVGALGPTASATWSVPADDELATVGLVRERILALGYE